MTYFPDLTPAHYGGHLDSSEWEGPLLAVGWLAGGQPYATGTLPQGFLDRLDRPSMNRAEISLAGQLSG